MTDNTETLYNALDKIKELEGEKCDLLGLIQQKDKLIEKMKCCGNCKYAPSDTYREEPCFSCQSQGNEKEFPLWELAEN